MADGSRLSGNLLALAGALCMAGYTILSKKHGLRQPFRSTRHSHTAARRCSSWHYDPKIANDWFFDTGVGNHHRCNFSADGRDILQLGAEVSPATISSIALLGEPVGSSLLALLIFQAVPGTELSAVAGAGGDRICCYGQYWSAKRPEASDRKAG